MNHMRNVFCKGIIGTQWENVLKLSRFVDSQPPTCRKCGTEGGNYMTFVPYAERKPNNRQTTARIAEAEWI